MMYKIAIIGAGIAGATLAHAIKDFAEVVVFEKARGAGGRVSTRYTNDFECDLGAPFFSVTHPAFHAMVSYLIKHNVVSKYLCKTQSSKNKLDIKELYTAIPRMNHLPKFLLKNSSTAFEHKVTHITPELGHKWRLHFEQQASIVVDYVISTAPPAQSKIMFPVNFEYMDILDEIVFVPALVLFLVLKKPIGLSWDILELDGASISRCIVNSHKPGRNFQPETLFIESTAEFAASHLDVEKEDQFRLILTEAQKYIDIELSNIAFKGLHQWRYANSIFQYTSNFVCFDKTLGLGVCGDWSEGGGVEAAFMSALKMAHSIRQLILGEKS